MLFMNEWGLEWMRSQATEDKVNTVCPVLIRCSSRIIFSFSFVSGTHCAHIYLHTHYLSISPFRIEISAVYCLIVWSENIEQMNNWSWKKKSWNQFRNQNVFQYFWLIRGATFDRYYNSWTLSEPVPQSPDHHTSSFIFDSLWGTVLSATRRHNSLCD